MSSISAIDKEAVKARAAGRWEQIVLTLAPSIAEAIEHPGKRHIDCPRHGGKGDFRVYKDFHETGGGVCTCGIWPDGIALIGAINGWNFKESLNEIAKVLFGGELTQLPIRRHVQKRDTAREDAATLQRLRALWSYALSVKHPRAKPFWTYLANRGLNWPTGLQNVRFHPAMSYYDEDDKIVGYFPGFLSRVQAPDGTSVSLHRTYLTEDGFKANVLRPKKLCGHTSTNPLQGTAIRLFNPGETLGVAEGIETACAVRELFKIPCWSTMSAALMESFEPPQGVRRVIFFGDRNRPTKLHPLGHGQEAATKGAENLIRKGIQAEVKLPPDAIAPDSTSLDWLDVLVRMKASRAA
jgi:hypothetical protein